MTYIHTEVWHQQSDYSSHISAYQHIYYTLKLSCLCCCLQWPCLNHAHVRLVFRQTVSPSLSLSDHTNTLMCCTSVAVCSFQTVSAWYIPSVLAGRGSSPFQLSICWLAVQPLSLFLSLSLCMEICLPTAQSTAPSNGRGAGPHHLICTLGLLVSVDGICFFARHQVLVGCLAPHHQWSAAPSHGGGAGPHHLVCIKISLVLLRRLRIDHMTAVSIA